MSTFTPVLNLEKPTVFGDIDAWGPMLNGNSDKLDALFDTGQFLKLVKGGTGAGTAADARTNLGLGSMATQADAPNNTTAYTRKGGTWAALAWTDISGTPSSFPPSAHTHPWSTDITGKPTTISGFGITDAYTKSEVYTKTEVDSSLSGKQNIGVYSGTLDAAASREIANTDLGKLLVSSVAVTLTLNSETMAVGSRIDLIASGGAITLAASGSKTILSLGNKLKVTTAGGAATLTKISANVWHLGGSLE